MMNKLLHQTLLPSLIIVSTTCLAVVFPYISVSKRNAFHLLIQDPIAIITQAWHQVNVLQLHLWTYLFGIILFGIFSILCLPGAHYTGPKSDQLNFVPQYRNTALTFYTLAMLIQVPIIMFNPILSWYYELVSLAGCLVLFGFLVSAFLYIKGFWFPSAGERHTTGNPIFDFYTGIELYPRIGSRLDLKQLINCRFGMWLWQLHILAAFKANHEMYPHSPFNYRLAVNVLLQTVYIAKFFSWEKGYMQTIDIALDHLGYYVGWGCIVWVPLFYTFSSISSVQTAADTSFTCTHAAVHLLFGLIAIWLNYETDAQRQRARNEWTHKQPVRIWGRKARTLAVQYTDVYGKKHSSMLLADGFWAWARHINYLFELLAAFLWSLAVSNSGYQVFFYFCFLTVLLVHRNIRDELKCAKKYGPHWQNYKQLVPYQIIPYIY